MADNVLKELVIKVSLQGAEKAKKDEDALGRSADKATKELKDQAGAANSLSAKLSQMGSTLSTISNLVKGLVIGQAIGIGFNLANKAIDSLTGTIDRAIDEASGSEQALRNLSTALSITGENSEGAMEDMKAFASEMQKTSTASTGTTISMLAQAKALGLTNAQAKLAVQSGIDFAAATGKSIPEGVQAMTASFSGMTKEVQKYVPEIKDLTDEQLKAGKAVELMNRRFSGSAAKNLNTYAGAAAQLGNAWSDIFDNIGGPIIQSLIPIFKDLTVTINKLLPSFTAFGEKVADSFDIVRKSFFGAFDLGGGAEKALDTIGDFIIDAALLVQDFFFFLKGERSFLGELTGAGNLGELIGSILGKGLANLPELLLNILFKSIPIIFDLLKGFLEGFIPGAIKAIFINIPKAIVTAVIEGLKEALPFADNLIAAYTNGKGIGLDKVAKGLPDKEGIQTIYDDMYLSDEEVLKRKKERSTGASPRPAIKGRSQLPPTSMPEGGRILEPINSPMPIANPILTLSETLLPSISKYAEKYQNSQNMGANQFAKTITSENRARADATAPGDQTLNKNDQRSYTNNLDVKINTNSPAEAIQRQINSLHYSQMTAGSN